MHKMLLSVLFIACAPNSVQAGPFEDELEKCVSSNLTNSDREAFMSFVFLALSEHPKVKQFSRTDPDQYCPIMLDYVSSFERLILKDCNKEAKDAIRFEGIISLGAASSKIGQFAIRDMMQSPEVAKVYDHMQKLSDEGEWNKLLE